MIRDRRFLVAFGLLWAATLTALWVPRFLPLLDLPTHLNTISVWNHFGDPSWGQARVYEPRLFPVPYLGYWLSVHWLSNLFSVETANRIFLSLYALTLPLSFSLLCQRLGRSRWLGLLSFPFVFNYSFAFGYLSCASGIPLVFFSLVALIDCLRAPDARRWTILFAAAVGCFFMHFLPYFALGVFSTAILLMSMRPLRPALVATSALFSSALVAAGVFVWSRAHTDSIDQATVGIHAKYQPFADALSGFARALIINTTGPASRLVLIVLALAVLLLTILRPVANCRTREDRLAYALIVAAAILYLSVPMKVIRPVWIWALQPRYAFFFSLMLLLFVRGPIAGARRAILFVALAACLIYPLALTRSFVAFSARARGLETVMAEVPRGKSTLTIALGDNVEPTLDPDMVPFISLAGYPTIWKGGPMAWHWWLGFPYAPKTPPLPMPNPWRTAEFDQLAHGRFWDYVVTRNEARDGAAFGKFWPRVPLIAKSGDWRLYATRGIDTP